MTPLTEDKQHDPFATRRTCMRVSLSTLRVGPAKLAISVSLQLTQNPRASAEKRTLKSPILSLSAILSFTINAHFKVDSFTHDSAGCLKSGWVTSWWRSGGSGCPLWQWAATNCRYQGWPFLRSWWQKFPDFCSLAVVTGRDCLWGWVLVGRKFCWRKKKKKKQPQRSVGSRPSSSEGLQVHAERWGGGI